MVLTMPFAAEKGLCTASVRTALELTSRCPSALDSSMASNVADTSGGRTNCLPDLLSCLSELLVWEILLLLSFFRLCSPPGAEGTFRTPGPAPSCSCPTCHEAAYMFIHLAGTKRPARYLFVKKSAAHCTASSKRVHKISTLGLGHA